MKRRKKNAIYSVDQLIRLPVGTRIFIEGGKKCWRIDPRPWRTDGMGIWNEKRNEYVSLDVRSLLGKKNADTYRKTWVAWVRIPSYPTIRAK